MNERYAKAYTEVLEIISHFSEEEYSKIPSETIRFYEENMDTSYNYKINPQIDLNQQYISKEAEALLVILFRDYFATPKQKDTLNNLLRQNQEKTDKEKYEKYNPNKIFKNGINATTTDDNQEEVQLVAIKEEKWYIKILNFFKSIFKKENEI